MLIIKAKPSVPPPNCAVHDEGEKPGGVIGRDSPRCFYSEIRGGWGRVGGGRNAVAAGVYFALRGAIYSQAFGWGAGVFCAAAVSIFYSRKMAGL